MVGGGGRRAGGLGQTSSLSTEYVQYLHKGEGVCTNRKYNVSIPPITKHSRRYCLSSCTAQCLFDMAYMKPSWRTDGCGALRTAHDMTIDSRLAGASRSGADLRVLIGQDFHWAIAAPRMSKPMSPPASLFFPSLQPSRIFHHPSPRRKSLNSRVLLSIRRHVARLRLVRVPQGGLFCSSSPRKRSDQKADSAHLDAREVSCRVGPRGRRHHGTSARLAPRCQSAAS